MLNTSVERPFATMLRMLRPAAPHFLLSAFLALLADSPGAPGAAAPDEPTEESGALLELVAEAGRALIEGDLETAAKSFTKANQEAPFFAPGWLGTSAVEEAKGSYIEALAAARRAAELEPDSPQATLAVGRLLARLRRHDDALVQFTRLRELAPDEVHGYVLAAVLLRQKGLYEEAMSLLEVALTKPEATPETSAELIRLLLTVEEVDRARQIAVDALDSYPDRGELHFLYGVTLATDEQRRQEAITEMERGLELGLADPGNANLEIAQILTDDGRAEEALVHLQTAVELLPESPEAHYRLGTALRVAGDAAGARTALKRSQGLSRESDRLDWDGRKLGTALNEAQELVNQGRLPEALERLDEILAAGDQGPRALILKAKVLFSLGRTDEAMTLIDEARAISPGAVEGHLLAGMFLMHLGRAAEAEKALSYSLAIDPTLAEPYALLGSLAADGGRLEEAAQYFEQALTLGGESAALRLRFADVLLQLGRDDASDRQLEVYRRLVAGTDPKPPASP